MHSQDQGLDLVAYQRDTIVLVAVVAGLALLWTVRSRPIKTNLSWTYCNSKKSYPKTNQRTAMNDKDKNSGSFTLEAVSCQAASRENVGGQGIAKTLQ